MKKIPPAAFFITHEGDKEWLMNKIMEGSTFDDALPLAGLRGEIFSNITLRHFIDEEIRHDRNEIATANNTTLAYSSSGEQRKALLSHIIAKKPDYIVIDNVFESIDKDARQYILTTLNELADRLLLIQVFNRQLELLHFIETVYTVKGQAITAHQSPQAFLAQLNLKPVDIFTDTIPSPLVHIEIPKAPLVKMRNVCVQFNGRPVLQNICWQINKGEFWQLTGANGSGKSTLLKLITGDSPKGYGQDLEIFGHRKGTGETVWQIKEKIGYFTPSMTMQFDRQDSIEQMVISGIVDSVGLYIKPTDRQVQLAREWLLVIGMYKDKNLPFRMLPEGHQRMILIARAMIKHPPLLILDEPTSGLDDQMAGLIITLINKIAAETTTSILYVSHHVETGLSANKIYKLTPTDKGSVGKYNHNRVQ